MKRRATNVVDRSAGFTLVELLVSMAVLGILLSALIALSSSLLGFSARSSTVSANLTDLSDVLGHVSLNVRNARAVWDGVTIDAPSGDFVCALADECLALLAPVTLRLLDVDDEEDGSVSDHEVIVYRVVAVEDWLGELGDPPELEPLRAGWRGSGTPVLIEYRSSGSCAGSGAGVCTEPPAMGTVSVLDPRLVVHGVLDAPAGGALFDRVDDVVTVRMQAREVARGTTYTVPRDTSLVADVFLR